MLHCTALELILTPSDALHARGPSRATILSARARPELAGLGTDASTMKGLVTGLGVMIRAGMAFASWSEPRFGLRDQAQIPRIGRDRQENRRRPAPRTRW